MCRILVFALYLTIALSLSSGINAAELRRRRSSSHGIGKLLGKLGKVVSRGPVCHEMKGEEDCRSAEKCIWCIALKDEGEMTEEGTWRYTRRAGHMTCVSNFQEHCRDDFDTLAELNTLSTSADNRRRRIDVMIQNYQKAIDETSDEQVKQYLERRKIYAEEEKNGIYGY